jgi:hypothetical protein
MDVIIAAESLSVNKLLTISSLEGNWKTAAKGNINSEDDGFCCGILKGIEEIWGKLVKGFGIFK